MKRAYKTESRIKTALFYAVELLMDVLIVYVIVRGFSLAYSFSYEVFSDSAKNAGDTSYSVVKIEPDFTSMSVSEQLYDKGVIKNKYVMLAKIKLGEYGRDIRPGKYALSPSMTYDEILKIITTGVAVNGEEETDGENSGTGTGTATTESDRTTETVTTEAQESGEDEGGDEETGGEESGGEESGGEGEDE